LLSGKNFFEINRMTPYKKIIAIICQKFFGGAKPIPHSIINNKSLKYFCSENRINDRFISLVNSSSLHVKENILEIEKLINSSNSSDVAKFWLLNKKMNIVFMSLKDN
jgi:hypothetical protein